MSDQVKKLIAEAVKAAKADRADRDKYCKQLFANVLQGAMKDGYLYKDALRHATDAVFEMEDDLDEVENEDES